METVTINNPKASYGGSIGGKFLVLAHQGISSLPDMMVTQEVTEGKLVKVLSKYALIV